MVDHFVDVSDMKLTKGRQLYTRDGRKMGNAIVRGFTTKQGSFGELLVWEIETDFGDVYHFTESELSQYFFSIDEVQEVHRLLKWDFNSLDRQCLYDIVKTLEPGEAPDTFCWYFAPVIVRGEDFSYSATCLCSFPKTNGNIRYIVEDNGRLFIQRRDQLEFAKKKQPEKEDPLGR